MYACERCGTRFGRAPDLFESCPRCLAREGARTPLVLEPAGDGGSTIRGLTPPASPHGPRQTRASARQPTA